MFKQIRQKLLYKPRLDRIIELDRKGNDIGTKCYLYQPSVNLFSIDDLLDPNEKKRLRLYCIISESHSYRNMGTSYFINYNSDFKNNYSLPKGLSKDSDIYSGLYERSKVSVYLRDLVHTVLDFLCVEIVEIIKLDLKINAELVLANSNEISLLTGKRHELQANFYQPFQIVLGNLFDRLEKERLLQENALILDVEPAVSKEVLAIVNSPISSTFIDRQEKAMNLLQSFKDLD